MGRSGPRDWVQRFLSSSNRVAFQFRVARKIKKIRERLDEINKEKQSFGLTKREETIRPSHRGTSHSHIDPNDVIGRDDEKEDIVKFLLHDAARSNNLSIIAIVRMGGLGKTALPKLICNDDEVDQHFDLTMWACVSDDFELKTAAEKIIKATKNSNSKFEGSSSETEMEVLQTMLREKINGRRYLLFLDDVWNKDKTKWDELETLLRVGAAGSTVIVTTRSNKVASIMGTVKPYILEGLPHDVCMSIFIKYAFNKGEEKQYPAQVKIGDEIVKKCGGVPLAVRTLASLLYPGTDAQKWKEIRDSQIWKLEEKDKYILPALKLNYERLPFHLKRCFAYCSIFPKDFFFYGHYLAQFWMAHGLLVCANENVALGEVGLSNIRELEARCFFQDFEDLGFSISSKMHDLVNDLALSVAEDECLTISSATHLISRRVRHLSFAEFDLLPPNIPSLLQGLDPIVRTNSVRPAKESAFLNSFLETSFSRFKYMRALDFQCCQIEVLPSTIGDLKHLRYLNLRRNKLIKRLPDSIFKLQNLETLVMIDYIEFEELPENIKLLVSLRFLWISTKQKIFPKNSISSLTSIQELCFFRCDNLEFLCDDLQGLINLRSLRI